MNLSKRKKKGKVNSRYKIKAPQLDKPTDMLEVS